MAFKVGDRVRRTSMPWRHMTVGSEWTVCRVRPAEDGNLEMLDVGDDTGFSWCAIYFELVEPAEVEQATAILDGQQDDGWWDANPWGNLLNAAGQQTLSQLKQSAQRFGLEVRVQVRRVQS